MRVGPTAEATIRREAKGVSAGWGTLGKGGVARAGANEIATETDAARGGDSGVHRRVGHALWDTNGRGVRFWGPAGGSGGAVEVHVVEVVGETFGLVGKCRAVHGLVKIHALKVFSEFDVTYLDVPLIVAPALLNVHVFRRHLEL